MILTCPGCSARYRVKDGLIPSAGKKVKCKKCSVVFRAFPDGKCEAMQAALPPMPTPPPGQPAATATVRVDAEKIQALVMQQQSAGQENRKPLPEVPENVVVEQKPLQTAAKEPETKSQAEPAEEPRKSFTEFREGLPPSDDGVPLMQTSPPQDGVFDEPVAKAAATDDVAVEHPKASSAAEVKGAFTDTPQTDFQFDAPPDDESGDSALKSELDEFKFELPEEPQKEEIPNDPFADLGTPVVEPAETAAMPVMEHAEPGPVESDVSADGGFPDIETGELASPATAEPLVESEPVPPEEPIRDEKPSIPVAETPAEEEGETEQLFEAKIDGTLYPKLTMEVIDRWIREGRLLESDYVAVEGTGEFNRADHIPQFDALFARYFGKKPTASTAKEDKPKKKGFFARMFKK